jgi:RNA polymerase subunit RPABC4/transcription elongation factor Spt4
MSDVYQCRDCKSFEDENDMEQCPSCGDDICFECSDLHLCTDEE